MKGDPQLAGLARARLALVWLVPVLLGTAVAFAPAVLNDADTFWHIAAGRWILAHHAVPNADPFSFTFAGKPWIAHEWLSEALLAAAFGLAGWGGVMLLTGLAAGVLAAVMAAWLIRFLPPLSTFATLALGFSCVAPGLLARPHLLALPLAAIWTVALLKARVEGRAPPILLALAMAVWANLHSSFIVGFAVAGLLALEAALDRRNWSLLQLRGWAFFLAATFAAALATPHGFAGFAFPLRVMGMRTLPLITEWLGPDFLKPSTLELALLAGIAVAFWRGVRLSAPRALLLLLLVHMSLQHVRQEAVLGALAPLLLAEPLGRALGEAPRPVDFPWRAPRLQAAFALCLAAAAIALRLIVPQTRTDGATAPLTALAHVPAALRAQPVLNDYDFGGVLIFQGVRPFIDGRADMYGDAFVAADAALQNGDAAALRNATARWRFGWAIVKPDRALASELERAPGWRTLYADRWSVVLARGPT